RLLEMDGDLMDARAAERDEGLRRARLQESAEKQRLRDLRREHDRDADEGRVFEPARRLAAALPVPFFRAREEALVELGERALAIGAVALEKVEAPRHHAVRGLVEAEAVGVVHRAQRFEQVLDVAA